MSKNYNNAFYNAFVFIFIAVAMLTFVGCANCTYDEKLGACIEDLPAEDDKTDDTKTDDNAKTDDEKSDTDIVEPKQGEEGGECFANKSCMEGLECVKVNKEYLCIVAEEVEDDLTDEESDEASDEDTVDPDLGKEGHGCLPNSTCNEGLTCEQGSQNDIDICVKVVGTIGEKDGSCKADRTCNTGLVCYREDFLCNDMPTIGTRTVCWSRELNTSPVQDSCSAKGGIAPAVFEYITGTKTPDCEGLVNVDPEFECVRTNATVETFRNSTPAERDNLALTSSFYLPPIN